MIHVCEVGPRDGLQNEQTKLSPEIRAEFITRVANAGVDKIEAVSFVNAHVVPQMQNAESVLDLLPEDLPMKLAGLVLSATGMERAILTRVDTIHLAMATSDTFNQRNVRRSVEESVEELSALVKVARQARKSVTIVLGTAFGCPFEGDVPLQRVLSITNRFLQAGCNEVVLADTTGLANPKQVQRTVEAFDKSFDLQSTPLGLHFHNTRGLGLTNVYAGYSSGVTKFDASIGGLGGCPFAPKAVGNVCTEDMVNLFEQLGEPTSCNLSELIETAGWIEQHVGRRLDGMMMKQMKD